MLCSRGCGWAIPYSTSVPRDADSEYGDVTAVPELGFLAAEHDRVYANSASESASRPAAIEFTEWKAELSDDGNQTIHSAGTSFAPSPGPVKELLDEAYKEDDYLAEAYLANSFFNYPTAAIYFTEKVAGKRKRYERLRERLAEEIVSSVKVFSVPVEVAGERGPTAYEKEFLSGDRVELTIA